ncbi:MAG TPA: GNAT family N-acetyltransferase [Streptosporangiaceae bacterium]|jgi:GNAT superfamily N-acetyltransferase
MILERFSPADDAVAVRACHQIYQAARPVDDPDGPPSSLRVFATWIRLGWTEDPSEAWLARDDAGEIRGWYVLTLPERENRHLAMLNPTVHPRARRAGWGTALVRHAAGRAAGQGRAELHGDTRAGSPGSAFARALGAQQGMSEITRVLRLDTLPAARLAGLRTSAQAAAPGYGLVCWDGPVPGEHLDAVAAINAGVADIPREPGIEAQRWDTERVRMDDRRAAAQGLRYYTVAARHLATGELAGLTQMGVDPAEPAWGFQELTVVARPHRGHRLGMLMKAVMLERLGKREPQLTQVLTGSVDANKHMSAINAELGFTVLDRYPSWQLTVTTALAL